MAFRTEVRSWFPRSLPAGILFLALLALAAIPAAMAFFMALVFNSECFLTSCPGPQRGSAVVAGMIGVAFLLVPFAGVRFFQSDTPVPSNVRLAIAIGALAAVLYPLALMLGLS